ncbi:MAG: S8 family serine peptidase, partial [Clostridia bacterium]|nr:S8 family serine peptidase [Clostridia bacterium]
MSTSWKRVLSVVLSLLLVAAFAVPAMAASGNGGAEFIWSKVSNNSAKSHNRNTNTISAEPAPFKASDVVRVSILLDGESTLDKFGFENAKGIAENTAAMNYRNSLKAKQNRIAERISEVALDGEKLDVVWNLTLAANVISANVKYGKIEAISKVLGVKAVAVESTYEPEKVTVSDTVEPNMGNAATMTNSYLVWESGYTGAGSIVAIIDTGLDTEHELFDPDAFDYAIEEVRESGKEVSLLDEEKVAELLPELHAYERMDVSAADLYLSSKVPFAFNYADDNLSVNHVDDLQGEHGSHVAGIAAGNRYVSDGNGGFVPSLESVLTQGQAPDAQVLVMKYFGATGGSDSDYFAAIEDAILLGADSVNLSLGTPAASGFAYYYVYKSVFEKLRGSSLTMVCSAGNYYAWADNANYPGYLYSEDVNFDTIGSPGSYTDTLAVASVENDGVTAAYLLYDDEMMFYTETSGYGNEPITTIAGEHEFIYIDAP